MKSYLAALAAALLLAAPSAALAQAGSKGAVKVGVLLRVAEAVSVELWVLVSVAV